MAGGDAETCALENSARSGLPRLNSPEAAEREIAATDSVSDGKQLRHIEPDGEADAIVL